MKSGAKLDLAVAVEIGKLSTAVASPMPPDISPVPEPFTVNLKYMTNEDLTNYLYSQGHTAAANKIKELNLIGEELHCSPLEIYKKLKGVILKDEAIKVAQKLANAKKYSPPREKGAAYKAFRYSNNCTQIYFCFCVGKHLTVQADHRKLLLTWYSDVDMQQTHKIVGCGLCRIEGSAVVPILRFDDVNDGDELQVFVPEIPSEDMRIRQLESYVANRDSDFEAEVGISLLYMVCSSLS